MIRGFTRDWKEKMISLLRKPVASLFVRTYPAATPGPLAEVVDKLHSGHYAGLQPHGDYDRDDAYENYELDYEKFMDSE